MERALEALRVEEDEAKAVDGLPVRANIPIVQPSFYEGFVLRGIRVDRVQPGFVLCSFTVLPRHIDRSGKMAAGAVVTLVDMLGAAAITSEGHYEKPSVDMNIAFISPAKLGVNLPNHPLTFFFFFIFLFKFEFFECLKAYLIV